MASKSSLYKPYMNEINGSKKKDPAVSASSLTFNSTLSSLLSSASSKPQTSRPSPRPSKAPKDDIFSSHNRGSKKRALADISDGVTTQRHSTTSQEVDAATIHRSKRKMEEKARLYASMKRGDYVPRMGGRDKETEGLVDFDRKWADEAEKAGDTSSDDYASSEEGDQELVEYEDEFGRVRKGTKAEAAKLERAKHAAAHAGEELQSFSARPERPNNLIVGDTVQASAFNPDETIAQQMARLAEKRDRSLTPPPETHYDASKEIRSKGVGFYQFSKDNEERGKQMEELGKEREETERMKKEREERREKKKRELEERRQLIAKKRGEKLAEKFLDEFDVGDVPPRPP